MTRADELDFTKMISKGVASMQMASGARSRMLPDDIQRGIQSRSGEEIYSPIQEKYRTTRDGQQVKASVKLLAACQDDEETLDGAENGIFTEAFINIFREGKHTKTNGPDLIAEVCNRYSFPRPNFYEYGSIIDTFDKGFPFEVNIPDAGKVSGWRKPASGQQTPATAKPSIDLTDELQQRKNAVVLVETEGGIDAAWIEGRSVKVLDKTKSGNTEQIMLEIEGVPNEQSWTVAHALRAELKKANIDATVEPVLTVTPAQKAKITREGDANNPGYIDEWPPAATEAGIGWHLDDAHSQLATANKMLMEERTNPTVRIGHFDTGYIENHVAIPMNLKTELARSFVSKEPSNQAIDHPESGQDGHGLGTMSLLAGNKVKKTDTFDEYEGYIGGAPFAEIVPVRLSESVVILNSRNFCDAIDYAIEQGCEVVSMSMSGKPSERMAEAINRAYEAGIVVVAAASNCWYKGPGKLLPKCVMFPAAFQRVIAATGALYNHKPYDRDFRVQERAKIGTQYMQGSWGPESRMHKALAAYTPNTPWASSHYAFVRSGGGTSSATPQVAAAAALWIAYHRDELVAKGYYEPGQQWKKVEAVRNALYTSAAKENVFADFKKYYGNGILRAADALRVGVPDESELSKAEAAECSFTGITELVGSFFKNRRLFRAGEPAPESEALATELMHLLQTDPAFYDDFSTLDLSSTAEMESKMNDPAFRNKIVQSPYASAYLKQTMITSTEN
ncbi:MAG: hypothetical protein EOO05_14580 [Chitinophagaceae bacterium]|nr:MAG: hypothetical protein EOO05_14580 [Chitinophagaceae bacterium]